MSGYERPLRVLLIGRWFWPHAAIDSAAYLIELASGLRNAGLHIKVVTPKFAASWSDRFQFREFEVHRPIRLFRNGWTVRGDRSASRYIRRLREWICEHCKDCDLIYCDAPIEEVISAVDAARVLKVPLVVRHGEHGSIDSGALFPNTRMGKRCRAATFEADALIVHTATDLRNWIAQGGDRSKVHLIHCGVPSSIDPSAARRAQIRAAMAGINRDLHVLNDSKVLLSTERLEAGSGVKTLLDSAYSLSQKFDQLHFWFIGDGPNRDSYLSQMTSDGLRQITAMPGSFAPIDEVFLAADLMIQSGDVGYQYHVPAAVASCLPIVTTETASSREFFGVSRTQIDDRILYSRRTECMNSNVGEQDAADGVWWFAASRPRTLRLAIDDILGCPQQAQQRVRRVRSMLQRTRPQSESILNHVALFRRLVQRRGQTESESTATMEQAP